MTPAVRRLLREHGLGPAQIHGTGGGGRITRDDVLAVVEAHPDRDTAAPVPVLAAAPARGRVRDRRARPRPQRPDRSCSPTAPTKSSCR